MLAAVASISKEVFDLGIKMDTPRLQAFAQMTLGELAAQEYVDDSERAEAGIKQLVFAHELY